MELLCESFCLLLDLINCAVVQNCLELILGVCDLLLLGICKLAFQILQGLVCIVDKSFCLISYFYFFFSLLVFFSISLSFLYLSVDLILGKVCGGSDYLFPYP